MSARIWKQRRKVKRGRAGLRKVWRYHASVRRLYPVKTDWLDMSEREPL